MIVDEGNAWQIHSAYQQAEKAILTRIKKYLADDLEVPDYQLVKLSQVQALRAEAFQIFQKVQPEVAKFLQDQISKTYTEANLFAYADIGKGLTPDKLTPLQSQLAVRNIVDEMSERISTAESQILRQVDDVFRESIANVTRNVLTRGMTRNEAVIDSVLKLGKQGVGNFTDQSGRNWTLPNYAEMAVRTGTRRATISGYEDVLNKNKLDLVMVQPGPRACSICDRWARTILTRDTTPQTLYGSNVPNLLDGGEIYVEIDGSLSDARADGFQHPNCRCRLRAYLPGITDPKTLERPPWDEDGYKAQQKQRALENAIRKAKTEEATVTDLDKGKASEKVKALQEQMRLHLAENPDLKRQSAREQITGRLGDPLARAEAKQAREDRKTQSNVTVLKTDVNKPSAPKPPTTGKSARETADLTVLPKITKSETLEDAAKITNPGFKVRNPLNGVGNAYDNNCTHVVNAVELRARGYDVIARPIAGGTGRMNKQTELDWLDNNGEVRKMTQLGDLKAKTTVTRLREYTADMPVGSRGVISGAWARGGGAHIFNWELTDDGLRFYEGQNPATTFTEAGDYLRQMKPATLRMLRVDDLNPTNNMVGMTVEARTADRLAEIEAERVSPQNAKAVRNALTLTQSGIDYNNELIAENKAIRDLPNDNTPEWYDKRTQAWIVIQHLEEKNVKLQSQLVKLQTLLTKVL
jgi:hypothetical protein